MDDAQRFWPAVGPVQHQAFKRRLTDGEFGEIAMRRKAQELCDYAAKFWRAHKQGQPELGGAQVNFLIELERAAGRFEEFCKNPICP